LENISLGRNEFGTEIFLNTEQFLKQRLLFQGISGSWKTETIKKIIRGLKQATISDENPNGIQQIIFDWEGEYHPLRKHFPYLLIGDDGEFDVDIGVAEKLATLVRKSGASVIIDLSSFKDHELRQEYTAIFLNAILDVKKQYWKPCVVIIDEAHNLCRQSESRSVSKKPIIALCETGRKRGIATILVTQRLSALDKNASAQMVNRMIGHTVENADRDAAAKILGAGKEEADAIRDFEGGEFFVFGRALSERKVERLRTPVDENFEKVDLLNITPLNNYGQQIFEEISLALNGEERTTQQLNTMREKYVEPKQATESPIGNDAEKFDQEFQANKPIDTIQEEELNIPVEGKVTLTQPQLRKLKKTEYLDGWNQAMGYVIRASNVKKGRIIKKKIDVLNIIQDKTKDGKTKLVIKDYQQHCTDCNGTLEPDEKVICNKCVTKRTKPKVEIKKSIFSRFRK